MSKTLGQTTSGLLLTMSPTTSDLLSDRDVIPFGACRCLCHARDINATSATRSPPLATFLTTNVSNAIEWKQCRFIHWVYVNIFRSGQQGKIRAKGRSQSQAQLLYTVGSQLFCGLNFIREMCLERQTRKLKTSRRLTKKKRSKMFLFGLMDARGFLVVSTSLMLDMIR